METSTSDLQLVRHGREWFEHCMARAIVHWARQGGGFVRPNSPKGWSVRVGIWDWFRPLSGKFDLKPDWQSIEECYTVDAQNYRRAVAWLVATVPLCYALRVDFNAIREVFKRITLEQQRRIVEILYERYPP